MNLGETIYKLRTEKNLSQGDLAELLEVSRQSISKWENNSAVPELDKLVKLSEIFHVSLDALVKGEEAVPEAGKGEVILNVQTKVQGLPPRKIAGTILLCMAFLMVVVLLAAGQGLEGLVLSLPFLACGVICFVFQKHVGLWCAWVVYFMVDNFFYFATSVSRASIFYRYDGDGVEQLNMRQVLAWLMVISLLIIIAVTALRLGKQAFADRKEGLMWVIAAWVAVILLQGFIMIWYRTEVYRYLMNHLITQWRVYRLIAITLDWARIAAVTVALVCTTRLVRNRK